MVGVVGVSAGVGGAPPVVILIVVSAPPTLCFAAPGPGLLDVRCPPPPFRTCDPGFENVDEDDPGRGTGTWKLRMVSSSGDCLSGGSFGGRPQEVSSGRVIVSGGVGGRGVRVKKRRLLIVRAGS